MQLTNSKAMQHIHDMNRQGFFFFFHFFFFFKLVQRAHLVPTVACRESEEALTSTVVAGAPIGSGTAWLPTGERGAWNPRLAEITTSLPRVL
jgi:hypothetical protein